MTVLARIRILMTFSIFILIAIPIGCTSFYSLPTGFQSPAPQIFNLNISPDVILRDGQMALLIEFEFFDADGDVNINSVIDLDFDSVLNLDVNVREEIDQITHGSDGLSGTATKLINIDARGVRDVEQILIRISLIDSLGHRSNVLQHPIEIQPDSLSPRISACEIWFVDQPDGVPTSSYKIGREVFLMVEDLTLGVLEPDVLYAELSSPGSGWATVVPFFRTSDPHVYTSRFGPRLGVSVPSTSGATLLAFYRAFTNRQEICLAQAKVE